MTRCQQKALVRDDYFPERPVPRNTDSGALQVGDYRAARAHEIVRRNWEHVVPRSRCRPHLVVLEQIRVNEDTQLSCVTERGHAAPGFGTANAEWLFRPASRARNEFACTIRTPKRHFSTACHAERALEAADHCLSSIGKRGIAALTHGSHLQHTTSPHFAKGHQ